MGKRKAESISIDKNDPMDISEEDGNDRRISEGEKSELSEVILTIIRLS
jgi:hypothetical protein